MDPSTCATRGGADCGALGCHVLPNHKRFRLIGFPPIMPMTGMFYFFLSLFSAGRTCTYAPDSSSETAERNPLRAQSAHLDLASWPITPQWTPQLTPQLTLQLRFTLSGPEPRETKYRKHRENDVSAQINYINITFCEIFWTTKVFRLLELFDDFLP